MQRIALVILKPEGGDSLEVFVIKTFEGIRSFRDLQVGEVGRVEETSGPSKISSSGLDEPIESVTINASSQGIFSPKGNCKEVVPVV